MTVPYATETAPENRPAPLPALLDDVTETAVHYRRNHFAYPQIDAESWSLPITGAVDRAYRLSLDDLRARPRRTAAVLLECAGHRRTDFQPPISGVQWGLGALSQADWAGASLADLLAEAGIHGDAVEVVLHGADSGGFSGIEGRHTFSRSLPLAKALHPDTLLAYEMNGEPLPTEHGAPLRAVVPGWYAMDSVKWLTSIEVVTEPFRGVFQEHDYRFQPEGSTGIGTRIEDMLVHSLFVSVSSGDQVPAEVELSGIAWGGGGIAGVEVRVDNGPWLPATVKHFGPYQRSLWSVQLDLVPGQRDLAVRATDVAGRTQPDLPIWNKRGYVNNSVQHIQVVAAA
jgi:DMSO/TMAO reductase YedYZ molybdopterin-dependent catalytic subunit